jgi:hypothetical protein
MYTHTYVGENDESSWVEPNINPISSFTQAKVHGVWVKFFFPLTWVQTDLCTYVVGYLRLE